MSIIQILAFIILWLAAAIAIEKILPLIMDDYEKSKHHISVSSGLIGIFVAAIIIVVASAF